ncbi:hypothetical protein Tco_1557416, partial [Tanacetum coccineum]
MELMEICTKLSDGVLALENVKTAQDLEITSLKKRVKKREKKKKARTPQLKRRLFKIRIESSADKSLGDQEDASRHGRNIAKSDQDEEISFVQEDTETQGMYDQDIDVNTISALITTAGVSMRSEKSKEKAKERGSKEKSGEPTTRPTRGVIMQEPSESGIRKAVTPSQHDLKDKGKAKMIELEKPLKKKDQIKFDEEVAKRLIEELEAELEEEERMLFDNTMNWVDSFIPMDTEVVEGSKSKAKESSKRIGEELESDNSKKQKIYENVEAKVDDEAKMKKHMEIVPNDE